MRILNIVHRFDGGGVSRVSLNLVKALSKLDHVVVTVSSSCKQYQAVSECYVVKELEYIKPFNALLVGRIVSEKICDTIRALNPEAVIAHTGWFSSAFLGCKISAPVLIIIHGTYLNELKYHKYHPIKGFEKLKYVIGIHASHKNEILALRYLQHRDNIYIAAVSKKTREELVQSGIISGKVFSILNGVDKDVFKPLNKDYARSLVEEWFNIRLRSRVLLHVNPRPIKGTHVLLKAVAMLKTLMGEDFTLLIVGRLGPRTYREYVENMVRGLKLEENVKLLGYVEYEKLPTIYSAADLTVAPSYSEGSPLVIPESLACGTPVVATDVGGNSEYLEKAGIKHLLIKVEDYDFSTTLAEKILYALNNTIKDTVGDNIPSWYDTAIRYTEMFYSNTIFR